MRLKIELDGDHYAPGQRVTGRVNVIDGGQSRTLTLTVSFLEQADTIQAVAHANSTVLHEGDLLTGHAVGFDFELPADALPAVATAHSGLFWQLEARADRPGVDAVARAPLHVVVAS